LSKHIVKLLSFRNDKIYKLKFNSNIVENKVFCQLNKMKIAKMKAKKLLVSFLAIAVIVSALMLVSAGEITSEYVVDVEGLDAYDLEVSVVAGDRIKVEVYFTSLVDDTDVTVEAELEGEKVDTKAITSVFDVEENKSYKKTLYIEVPFELKDQASENIYLNIEVDGKLHKTNLDEITLRVQRPSYNAVIKSVVTPNSIEAGQTFPVDFVLKNMGYNELDDLYVEVSISELGISQGPVWVGDLVRIECETSNTDCDEDEDTVAGRLFLNVPYSVDEGNYELEFVVYNDDVESTMTKSVFIGKDFASEVLTASTSQLISVGENAEFSLLLVNPTNNVKVYKIVTESADGLFTKASSTMVAVPAGSSKTVIITANAEAEGNYQFDVSVFSGEDLLETITYDVSAEGRTANTTVILTVILAIIFLVLVVVLIVLIGRKPQKTEDFGESYY